MFFWFIWFRCSQIIILTIITSSHLAVEPWHPKLATAWKNVFCGDRNGCPETDSITVTWGKMMEKTLSKLRTDLEDGAIAATCWDPVLSRRSHETARNYGKLSIANLETWQVMPTCPAKGIVIWWSASICEGTQRYYDSFIRWHHPRSCTVLWSYCFLNPSACRDMLAMVSDTSIPSRLEISKKVVQWDPQPDFLWGATEQRA